MSTLEQRIKSVPHDDIYVASGGGIFQYNYSNFIGSNVVLLFDTGPLISLLKTVVSNNTTDSDLEFVISEINALGTLFDDGNAKIIKNTFKEYRRAAGLELDNTSHYVHPNPLKIRAVNTFKNLIRDKVFPEDAEYSLSEYTYRPPKNKHWRAVQEFWDGEESKVVKRYKKKRVDKSDIIYYLSLHFLNLECLERGTQAFGVVRDGDLIVQPRFDSKLPSASLLFPTSQEPGVSNLTYTLYNRKPIEDLEYSSKPELFPIAA